MSKIITIDFDNVLADTAGGFVQRYMSRTGEALRLGDLDQQYLMQCSALKSFVKEVGDPYLPFWEDVVDPESPTQIEPVEGSVDAVFQLIKNGYHCVIVTGRGEREREETYRRLDERFPRCFEEVIFGFECTDEYIDKGVLCAQVGSCVHIDDFIQNAQIIANVGIPTLLFDRSWNQDNQNHASIIRVEGWDDSLNRIDENLDNKKTS